MGAALDYANQNFPDTNPDGSPFSPAVSSIRGLAAVIDNAIPNTQDLAGLTSRIVTLEDVAPYTDLRLKGLHSDIENFTAETRGVEDDLKTRVATLEEGLPALTETVAALPPVATAAQRQDPTANDVVLTPAGLAASTIGTLFYGGVEHRPGEAVKLFCDSVAGGDPVGASTTVPGAPVAGATGPALRMTEPAVLAPRIMFPLERGRTYRMRLAVQRTLDTQSPIGDGIVFGVAFYGADRGSLGTTTPPDLILPLTVRDGPVTLASTVALDARQGVAIVAPPGACYARPYVQTYSAGQQTDVSVLAWSDISDAGLIAPDVDALAATVAALAARVSALPASSPAQATP